MAEALQPELAAAVASHDDPVGTPYVFSAAACARRALKNKALGYLATLGDPAVIASVSQRLAHAANMTDEVSALAALDLAVRHNHGASVCACVCHSALGPPPPPSPTP